MQKDVPLTQRSFFLQLFLLYASIESFEYVSSERLTRNEESPEQRKWSEKLKALDEEDACSGRCFPFTVFRQRRRCYQACPTGSVWRTRMLHKHYKSVTDVTTFAAFYFSGQKNVEHRAKTALNLTHKWLGRDFLFGALKRHLHSRFSSQASLFPSLNLY